MIKYFLPILLLFVTFAIPIDIFASGLEVSKSSGFSSSDTNFAGGEMVYVRVKTDEAGSSSVLNIRDNNYSSVSSINLNRSGDSYTASFNAPSEQGYYSLEAKIEGEGMNVTSVKTIKVGSPTSANINVSVKSSVKETKSTELSNGTQVSEGTEASEGTQVSDEVEVFSVDGSSKTKEESDKGFIGMIFGFFEGAWNLFKFF